MRRFAVLLLSAAVLAALPARAGEVFSPEPNPAFERALQASRASGRLGYIPPPFKMMPHLKAGFVPSASLPSRYDLRDEGHLTPVKDQGVYGVCWAFAGYGALESTLLRLGGGTYDFSERNLINRCGFDDPWNAGGNQYITMAYLSRGDGPVLEDDDPYSLGPGTSPAAGRKLYVEGAVFLPPKGEASDVEYIKDAIYRHGALATGMHWDDKYYDSASNTYYCGLREDPNHEVVLVGWDDSRVVPGAPGPGAWIVRNSWGTGWGEGGYFYISYYDVPLASDYLVYFVDEPDLNGGNFKVLYHDELGMSGGIGYPSGRIFAANAFTVAESCRLEALSLGVFDLGGGYADYTVRVYRGRSSPPDVGSTPPDSSASGSISQSGYHFVRLPSPVELSAGERFVVVVEYRCSKPKSYPLGLEIRGSSSSRVTILPGESFYGPDGSSWEDLYRHFASDGYGNASIKAVLIPSSGPGPNPVEPLEVSPSSLSFGEVEVGSQKALPFSLKANQALGVVISCPEGFSASPSSFDMVANETRAVSVVFSPTQARPYSGVISISYGTGTRGLPVSGTGLQPGPVPDDGGEGAGGGGCSTGGAALSMLLLAALVATRR